MSDTPDVKLPVTCSRTGKTQEMKLPLDGVEKFLAEKRSREENVNKIEEFFGTLHNQADQTPPDLVVYYKGRLVVLPTVLSKSDQAVMRMLHEATQQDTFPKPTPRKRKAKKESEATTSSKTANPPKKNQPSGKSTSENVSAPAE